MTLNDVEQALRNLITNQPMVSSGPSGEVINNILSIVNAYRNFRFLLQNHPAQDSFKFNALNISQRTENDLANAICQTLQERGINLMIYIPPAQYAMNPTSYGSFQNVGQVPMPNMNNSMGVGTQVVYNNTQMPQPMQSSYQSGLQYNVPMGQYPPQQAPQGFNPMQNGPRGPMSPMPNGPMPNGPMPMGPRQPMMNNPVGRPGSKLYPRTAAPTQPISFGALNEDPKPIKPKKKSAFSIPKPVAQPTKVAIQKISKPSNEPKVQRNNEPKKLQPDLTKMPEPPIAFEDAPIESEPPMPVAEERPDTKKAAGRNYLLELLKK